MKWQKTFGIYLFADLRNFTKWSTDNLMEIDSLFEYIYESSSKIFNPTGNAFLKYLGDGFLYVSELQNSNQQTLIESLAAVFRNVALFETDFQTFKFKSTIHDVTKIDFGFGMSYGYSMKSTANNGFHDFIGDKLNLASRLCSRAKKTFLLLEDSFISVLPIMDLKTEYLYYTGSHVTDLKSFGRHEAHYYRIRKY